mgnify:CR=1 FL=1
MPRSTYYYREANPPSDRQAAERPAIVEMREKSQFRYGYRRVADTLRKATGIRIADKTVLKVMREEGLVCWTRRRRKYRSCMGQAGKSSPNLLARDFEAEDPMTKLVADRAGVLQAGWELVTDAAFAHHPEELLDRLEAHFAYPVFVKPAGTGSSVGVSKAKDRAALQAALEDADALNVDQEYRLTLLELGITDADTETTT